MIISDEVLSLIRQTQLVCFDFDGVFTDNKVYVNQDGTEAVVCDRSDGLGLALVRKLKVPMAILSTETNSIVQVRAKKLELPCYSGLKNKSETLAFICSENGLVPSQLAFIGNDINDLTALKLVGLPVAVNDAHLEVKKLALLVLEKQGGNGAVREFCELFYKIKNLQPL